MSCLSGMGINIDWFWSSGGQVTFQDVLSGRHADFNAVFVVTFYFSITFTSRPKIDIFMTELFFQKFLKQFIILNGKLMRIETFKNALSEKDINTIMFSSVLRCTGFISHNEQGLWEIFPDFNLQKKNRHCYSRFFRIQYLLYSNISCTSQNKMC